MTVKSSWTSCSKLKNGFKKVIMSERKIPKYVYRNRKKWIVKRWMNGKGKQYGSFDTLQEAIYYKDYLVRNNWVEPELSEEEKLLRLQKKYYVRVQTDSAHKYYRIKHIKGRVIGKTYDLGEALYFRDLYSTVPLNEVPNMEDCDLKTNNPYKDGFKCPVPERLKLTGNPIRRGQGSINKKSVSCYCVSRSHNHIHTCRTYEQAWYVKREMNKCNWNIDELPRILEEYPIFYTELLYYYIYISKESSTGKWLLTIPKDKSDDGNLQHIRYSNLEDALFERDFLVEHDWDYDLLVEIIDDRCNPYYEKELLPYPERKIRNISPRKSHDKELLKLAEVLRENPEINMDDWGSSIGVSGATLRNWFRQYNTNTTEFKEVVLKGENPLDYFEQEKLIYKPDLSKTLHPNYTGYVHYKPERRSKYIVSKDDVYYGAYMTKELADKVVKELIKVDWDKSCLRDIKKKLNIHVRTNERMYIYQGHNNTGSYRIRKKMNGKNVDFGSYKDLELAMIIRDMLINMFFECDDLEELREFGEYILHCRRLFYSNMFNGEGVKNC